jgi:hypothetical protein
MRPLHHVFALFGCLWLTSFAMAQTPLGQGCVASAELYHTSAGTTLVYWPPDPGQPSSASCLVFQPAAVAALVPRMPEWFAS